MDEESSLEPSCNKEMTHDVLEKSNSNHPIPRKKFALLMAYSGSGYYGMQVNHSTPHFPTIESTLLSALFKANCIPENYSSHMYRLQFQRCARTDKGVSAVGQLVSTRLLTSCSNPVVEINSHLPPEIRIIDMKRVTKGFNSRDLCDGRTYSYMLPTYALSACDNPTPDPNFRLPREDFHNINRFLSFYKGTHNYHNFTTKKTAEDRSAYRHMFSVSCSEPFVLQGIEFASILFTGQSFMMYQIRKMVGMIIAIARGIVSADFLPSFVQMDKYSIPTAPGLGLVLEHAHFERYNKQYADDGLHETLRWEESLPVIDAFREENIIPVIVQGELEDFSMCLWLDKLNQHNFLPFLINY
ncbi:pseudouridylate synthase 1 homolog [Pelodytes ibericus]